MHAWFPYHTLILSTRPHKTAVWPSRQVSNAKDFSMVYRIRVDAGRSMRVTRIFRRAGVGVASRSCGVSPAPPWAFSLCILKGYALSETPFHRHQEPFSFPGRKKGQCDSIFLLTGAMSRCYDWEVRLLSERERPGGEDSFVLVTGIGYVSQNPSSGSISWKENPFFDKPHVAGVGSGSLSTLSGARPRNGFCVDRVMVCGWLMSLQRCFRRTRDMQETHGVVYVLCVGVRCVAA